MSAQTSPPFGGPATPASGGGPQPPMYWRVLRLAAVRPNGWQRALLVEGVLAVAVILALSDAASAWVVLVLPLVSMAVVKAHDILVRHLHPDRATGALRRPDEPPGT